MAGQCPFPWQDSVHTAGTNKRATAQPKTLHSQKIMHFKAR